MGMIDYARRSSRAALLRGERVRWIANSRRRNYIAQVVLSTPDWVDRSELRAKAQRAACLTEMSGVPHELGHIVPLNHPRVCGLTVPWNLEVITAAKNRADSNLRWPDMWEYQMELF